MIMQCNVAEFMVLNFQKNGALTGREIVLPWLLQYQGLINHTQNYPNIDGAFVKTSQSG